MKKAILGTLLGAIVYFVWGAASWMLIPWHAATTKAVPQEQLVSDTLKTVIKERDGWKDLYRACMDVL